MLGPHNTQHRRERLKACVVVMVAGGFAFDIVAHCQLRGVSLNREILAIQIRCQNIIAARRGGSVSCPLGMRLSVARGRRCPWKAIFV